MRAKTERTRKRPAFVAPKVETPKPAGLTVPIEIPAWVWNHDLAEIMQRTLTRK